MYLTDGHSTIIGFADYPNVLLLEKTITPPGVDGGGPNDTTTMRNEVWRTMMPKKLKTLTESTFTAAYDPEFYEDAVDMVQDNQLITITFSDGSSIDFWGWLDKFIPNEHKDGEQPTAQCNIQPSNMNNDFEEVAPVYHPPV